MAVNTRIPTYVPEPKTGRLVLESSLELPRADVFNDLITNISKSGNFLKGLGDVGGLLGSVQKAGQVGMLTRNFLTDFKGISSPIVGIVGGVATGAAALFGHGDPGSKISGISTAVGSILGGGLGAIIGGIGSIVGGIISRRHAKKERAAQRRAARRKIYALWDEIEKEHKSFLEMLSTSTQALEEKYANNKQILENNKIRLNSAIERRNYALNVTIDDTRSQIDLALATGTTQSGIVSSTSDWFIPQKLDYTAETKRKELREESEELADQLKKLAVEQDTDYKTEKSKLEYAGKKKELEFKTAIDTLNDKLEELTYARGIKGDWFFKEMSNIGLGLVSMATNLKKTTTVAGRPTQGQRRSFQAMLDNI